MILRDVDFDEWQCNTPWSYSKEVKPKGNPESITAQRFKKKGCMCRVET